MKPTTWEEAAHAAAKRISNVIYTFENKPTVERSARLLGEFMAAVRSPEMDFFTADWRNLAARAVEAKQGALGTIDRVLETVISKQHDYGHGNILAYGIQGVCVRLSDKWARIQNLEKKGVDAQNESLLDSYLDLVGYCIIAIMLCEGTFELPLEEDLPFSDPLNVGPLVKQMEQAQFVKSEIQKAIDAHLAAFHPQSVFARIDANQGHFL